VHSIVIRLSSSHFDGSGDGPKCKSSTNQVIIIALSSISPIHFSNPTSILTIFFFFFFSFFGFLFILLLFYRCIVIDVTAVYIYSGCTIRMGIILQCVCVRVRVYFCAVRKRHDTTRRHTQDAGASSSCQLCLLLGLTHSRKAHKRSVYVMCTCAFSSYDNATLHQDEKERKLEEERMDSRHQFTLLLLLLIMT
jgi:hypothetical protein